MNQLYAGSHYDEKIDVRSFLKHRTGLKYVLLFFPVVTGAGMICLIDDHPAFNVWLKMIQLIIFLAGGLAYQALVRGKQLQIPVTICVVNPAITVAIAISGAIGITLLIFYLATGFNYLIMAFASSAAFIVPSLVSQAWICYNEIPVKEYPVWTKPAGRPEFDEILLPVPLSVLFTVAGRYYDQTAELFPKHVMGSIKLGNVFYSILEEENKEDNRIELLDEHRNYFGWEFYTPVLNGILNKRLDPESSFLENGIRDCATVIVKRIRATAGE